MGVSAADGCRGDPTSVQFDRRSCTAKNCCEGKSDRQQIDCGRIWRVKSWTELKPKRLVRLKFSRFR